jgi:hypothetical protein
MKGRQLYSTLIPSMLFFSVMAVSAIAAPEDCPSLWTQTWFVARPDKLGPSDRFSLRAVTQYGLHLTGQCAYFQLEGQSPRVAVIDGTDGKGCGFWPDVAAEVLDERTGTWVQLSNFFDYGHRQSVRVEPGDANADLFVSLDIFIPTIGKHRLGRLVLRTGEAAVFELEKLKEPKHETARGR